jgi:hypothetical protein
MAPQGTSRWDAVLARPYFSGASRAARQLEQPAFFSPNSAFLAKLSIDRNTENIRGALCRGRVWRWLLAVVTETPANATERFR